MDCTKSAVLVIASLPAVQVERQGECVPCPAGFHGPFGGMEDWRMCFPCDRGHRAGRAGEAPGRGAGAESYQKLAGEGAARQRLPTFHRRI